MTTKLPKVREVAPRIANELEPKLLALGLEKAALEEEARQLQHKTEQHDVGVADIARQARIAAILGHPLPPQPKPQRTRLNEIIERVSDIDGALSIIREDVKVERKRAAAKILTMVRSKHRERVDAFADALLMLYVANSALWAFHDELEADGVGTGSLGDFRPTRWGDPLNSNNDVSTLIRELITAGFIPISKLPDGAQA